MYYVVFHNALNRHIRTTKSRLRAPSIISNNRLNSSIQPRPQQKQPHNHHKDMHNRQHHPHRPLKQLPLIQLPISHRKINKSEEGIESRTEEREEITH